MRYNNIADPVGFSQPLQPPAKVFIVDSVKLSRKMLNREPVLIKAPNHDLILSTPDVEVWVGRNIPEAIIQSKRKGGGYNLMYFPIDEDV